MKTRWAKPGNPLSTAITKFRSPRRTKGISRRFKRMVGEAMQHPMIYKFTTDYNSYNAPSKCKWFDVLLGSSAQNTILLNMGWDNAEAYDIPDSNTGASSTGTGLQAFFQVYIKKYTNTIFITNDSTAPIHLVMFELKPRMNMGAGEVSPANKIITLGESGDLPNSTSAANLMDYQDPRFTPYMCKYLIALWKITAVKKYKLAAGQQVVIKQQLADYKLTNFFDHSNAPHVNLYRPGKCKALLFKHFGTESTDLATGSLRRTSEGMLRVRIQQEVHFNHVVDIRPIVAQPSSAFQADLPSVIIDPTEADKETIVMI